MLKNSRYSNKPCKEEAQGEDYMTVSAKPAR